MMMAVRIIVFVILQTVINVIMLSIGEQGKVEDTNQETLMSQGSFGLLDHLDIVEMVATKPVTSDKSVTNPFVSF